MQTTNQSTVIPFQESQQLGNDHVDGTEQSNLSKNNGSCSDTDVAKQIIFDSLDPEFHVFRFLHQLVSHLLFPLMFCSRNPYAQGLRLKWTSLWFSIIDPSIVYLILVSYWALSPADRDRIGYTFVIPLMFFVTHRTTVSLKYATLSSTEYERFMSCCDKKLIDKYINQMQLFAGWLSLDLLTISFELSAASSRMGVKINQIYFRIPCSSNFDSIKKFSTDDSNFLCGSKEQQRMLDEKTLNVLQHWNAFLSEEGADKISIIKATCPIPASEFKVAPQMVILSNGDYGVSVYDVCYSIIKRVKRGPIVQMMIPGFIVTLILVIIMWYTGIREFPQISSKRLVAMHLVAATVSMMLYGTFFFAFLVVAIFDVYRFYSMVGILHGMIRLTDLMLHRNLVTSNSASAYRKSEHVAKDRQISIMSISRPVIERTCIRNKTASPKDFSEEEEADEEYNYEQDVHPITRMSFFAASGRFLFSRKVNSVSLDPNNDEKKGFDQESKTFAMVPKVDLYFADNATAWIYTRLAIQNFGQRFRFRTDIYIGEWLLGIAMTTVFTPLSSIINIAFTLFLVMIMMIISLVAIVSTEEKLATYTSPLFLEAIVIVFLSVIDMVSISFLGSRANEDLRKHW